MAKALADECFHTLDGVTFATDDPEAISIHLTAFAGPGKFPCLARLPIEDARKLAAILYERFLSDGQEDKCTCDMMTLIQTGCQCGGA